jgi:hypothetical protein
VSASARVSLGYLSEVERGQKEASSELLSAICTALETPLSSVLREVSDNFALAELQNAPVLTGPRQPVRPAAPSRMDSLVQPVLEAPALDTPKDTVLGTVRLRPARAELRPGQSSLVRDDDEFGHHTGDVTNMVPV